jgi:hypothetical protein
VKKQPIINPQGLLEAILADCSADPSNFHPLKNSFKKLLQIQRSFKVGCALPANSNSWQFSLNYFLLALCRTKKMHWFNFGSPSLLGKNGPLPISFLQVQIHARWAPNLASLPFHPVAPRHAASALPAPP